MFDGMTRPQKNGRMAILDEHAHLESRRAEPGLPQLSDVRNDAIVAPRFTEACHDHPAQQKSQTTRPGLLEQKMRTRIDFAPRVSNPLVLRCDSSFPGFLNPGCLPFRMKENLACLVFRNDLPLKHIVGHEMVASGHCEVLPCAFSIDPRERCCFRIPFAFGLLTCCVSTSRRRPTSATSHTTLLHTWRAGSTAQGFTSPGTTVARSKFGMSALRICAKGAARSSAVM